MQSQAQYLLFLGLGIGMALGYRHGFLARPIYFSNPNYSYQKEHAGQKYNKRNDGRIECATSNTVNYIKVMICSKLTCLRFLYLIFIHFST